MGVDTGAAAEPIADEVPPSAEGAGLRVLSGPRGVADDLKKLHHVSPTIEKKLNDLGIFHYWQIAGLGPEAARTSGRRSGCRPASGLDRAVEGIDAQVTRLAPVRAMKPAALDGRHEGTDMAKINAQMVKELRERTGAGMMDCKAALEETGGDMEQAVDLLRKKGLAKAAKKAGRIAAEGLIGLAVGGTKGVVVEVNSETDFVARNDLFQGLVKMIANVALSVGADVEKIKDAKVGDITMAEAIADTIAKIGENMTLRRASSLSVGTGVIGSYTHNSVEEGSARSGCWWPWSRPQRPTTSSASAACSRCTSPPPIRKPSIPPASIPRSSGEKKEVLADKYKAQGKPANVIDKIVESGLKTFYKEVCLLDQPFVHEPDKSVSQTVKEAEGRIGGPIKVTGFVRYALVKASIDPIVILGARSLPWSNRTERCLSVPMPIHAIPAAGDRSQEQP